MAAGRFNVEFHFKASQTLTLTVQVEEYEPLLVKGQNKETYWLLIGPG